MTQNPYALTTAYIVVLDVILAVTAVQTLRLFGAPRAVAGWTAAALAAWLAVLCLAIPAGRFLPSGIGGAAFFAVLMAAVAAAVAAAFLSPVGDALRRVPQEFLLFPQGLRVFVGAGFLVEAGLGVIPATFGILDGLSHVTAGFLALMAAVMVKSPWASRRSVWTANLIGLLDIACVAAGLAFVLLKDIGPHHNVMYAAFFAAPLFIVFHLASLRATFGGAGSAEAAPQALSQPRT